MTDNNQSVVDGGKSTKGRVFNKKNIIILLCAVVVVALAVVLVCIFTAGSLASVLINIQSPDSLQYVAQVEDLEGMIYSSTMVDDRYGIFMLEHAENGYQYYIYDFVEGVYVTSNALDDLAVLNSQFGFVLTGTKEYILEEQTWTYTIVDMQGNEYLSFDDIEEYSYSNGFVTLNGVQTLFISPADGSVVEMDSSYIGMQLSSTYSYFTGDEYVVADYNNNALMVYSASNLQLERVIYLSSYCNTNSYYSLFLLANGNIYMQVSTQLDVMSTDYDVLISSNSKYNYDGYIINAGSGSITSKNVDYVVTDLSNNLVYDTDEYMKSNINIAEITYIVDRQLQEATSMVFMGNDMVIDCSFDDLFVGLYTVARCDGYYIGLYNYTFALCIFDSAGNMIAYDVELLGNSLINKGDTIYTLSGDVVRVMEEEQAILGAIDSSVVWYETDEDSGDRLYYLDDAIISTNEPVTILGDMYVITEQDGDSYVHTFGNASNSNCLQITTDSYEPISAVVVTDDYVLVSIADSYYMISNTK